MYLIDDIDSFEPKTTQILTQGLPPLCDHGGFDEGQFCCLNCMHPLFDRDDLLLEGSFLYCFRRALISAVFNFSFDATGLYPKTCLECAHCQESLGFINTSLNEEKKFYIFARSIILTD